MSERSGLQASVGGLGSVIGSSPWLLPTLAVGWSVRESVRQKRSTLGLLGHAVGAALLVQAGAIALGMSGAFGK